jgi:hypothetical protein
VAGLKPLREDVAQREVTLDALGEELRQRLSPK